jgi:hypothetical protein
VAVILSYASRNTSHTAPNCFPLAHCRLVTCIRLFLPTSPGFPHHSDRAIRGWRSKASSIHKLLKISLIYFFYIALSYQLVSCNLTTSRPWDHQLPGSSRVQRGSTLGHCDSTRPICQISGPWLAYDGSFCKDVHSFSQHVISFVSIVFPS